MIVIYIKPYKPIEGSEKSWRYMANIITAEKKRIQAVC